MNKRTIKKQHQKKQVIWSMKYLVCYLIISNTQQLNYKIEEEEEEKEKKIVI